MIPDLESIAAGLAARGPRLADPPETVHAHAGVALVLIEAEAGVELLFIERAHHPLDHWSGDMAFPGGRREAGDASIAATVAREVAEEIGLCLPEPLARLDDYDARSGRRPWPLVVSPFVYRIAHRPALQLNHEVAAAVWVPLARLIDGHFAVRHRFPSAAPGVSVPAVQLSGGRVVWGMTYRMLGSFLLPLGLSLPEPRTLQG